MRKYLAFALIASLMLALVPSAALAGDPHAVRNRWLGAAIGAGSVVMGGILYNVIRGSGAAVAAPSTYGAPPVVTTPPSVFYSAPPPVVYAPPPVVEYRTWVPGVKNALGADSPIFSHTLRMSSATGTRPLG